MRTMFDFTCLKRADSTVRYPRQELQNTTSESREEMLGRICRVKAFKGSFSDSEKYRSWVEPRQIFAVPIAFCCRAVFVLINYFSV